MSTAHWEHYAHEADMGIRGFGQTKAEAFAQAAVAMLAVMTDLESVSARTPVAIECEAPDAELLLTDWLNAIIFEIATRKMLFARFDVELRNHRLSATAWGEPIDASRHTRVVEVKGATYTDLKVQRRQDGWMAQCVVDV
jgi:tRNA nucleotidyltransferase (CCA-adding enzyme)